MHELIVWIALLLAQVLAVPAWVRTGSARRIRWRSRPWHLLGVRCALAHVVAGRCGAEVIGTAP
jgi:hypothetical protein